MARTERKMKMKTDIERKAFLRNELKEFEKTNPMTNDEHQALQKWINAGNSIYENSMMAVGYNYLEEYRDTKYIRKATKGMSAEAAQRFAWNYYGWDYDSCTPDHNTPSLEDELIKQGY